MGKYIMSIDQGTTSTRCIILNKQSQIVSISQKEITQIFLNNGWVEEDPLEIFDSVLKTVFSALEKANLNFSDIDSIGITNQRETTIVWDKTTGLPVYNAIVWQCRRTADYCLKLKNENLEESIKEKTGLVIDPYFSLTKICWILENISEARIKALKGDLCFGTVDSYILYRLTKGTVHATDYSNASRTMLFNINTLCYDSEILDFFKIPISMLPKVYPSSHLYGYTDATILGYEVPICGIAGDQQASLFGQTCFNEGDVKNTYGTGCFLLMNTGTKKVKSKNGLLTTIAFSLDNQVYYALEGSVFTAGSLIKWLKDDLKLLDNVNSSSDYAKKVSSTNGVYLVPAFVGLGAPHWNPYARGILLGLTREAKKEHIIRAALEAIAYQTNDILKAMEEDSSIKLTNLKVDGGASFNDFLVDFQSNISNLPVFRPKILESTALGAAYLAGLQTGFFKSKQDICDSRDTLEKFVPSMDSFKRDSLLMGWRKAVASCINSANI